MYGGARYVCALYTTMAVCSLCRCLTSNRIRSLNMSTTSLLLVPLFWSFWVWLSQSVQKLELNCGSNEANIQIKLIVSQKYCMNEIRVIGTFLGSGSLDPNMWVLLPYLDPNIKTLLWWIYIRDVVIMWLAWQTWLTQPGKFNLQLQSPSWNYDRNIRIRKRWFNTKFTPQILVLHIRVKKWFTWTHMLGSNDWYNTFGVIFRFKPRYLVQTWTWTLWHNQALKSV